MPALPPDRDLSEMRDNPEYLNWLAVGDGLRMLCEGLREYTKAEMQDFHASVSQNLRGYPVCTCSPPGKTTAHLNTCRWATELGNQHLLRKKKLIPWHQSDSSNWHDPNHGYWEIAKLFMSDLGRKSSKVKDPDTTDATGLLNLLNFCKHFKVNRNLVGDVRRDCRNAWAHAPHQHILDKDKKSAFQAIFKLMNDVELKKCKAVQDWRSAIEKARDEDISQQHESRVLKEFRKIQKYKLQEQQSKFYEHVSSGVFGVVNTLLVLLTTAIYLPGLGSNCLRYFQLLAFIIYLFGFIPMGNKPLPQADKVLGCSRAYTKSPISHFGFQEFNFSSDLNYKKANFFGRKWLFQELENIFANDSGQSGVLITAEPGSGKSALMAQLICSPSSSLFIHRNIIAFHMCDYSELGKRNGAWFVRNLVDQIAGSLREYASYISDDKQVRDQLDKRCERDVVGCFHGAVLAPLRELKNPPDGLRYIFIDALDECFEKDRKTSDILEILRNKLIQFPSWLKVVVTSRNWTAVTNKLPRMMDRLTLDPTDQRNVQDIELYILHFFSRNTHFVDRLLEAMGLQKSKAETMSSLVREMTRKGEGNFLFVKTTLEYYNTTRGVINLKSFPKRLDDTYRIFFERRFGEGNFSRFKILFEVLLAASSPLKDKEIASILQHCNPMYTEILTFQLFQDVSSFLRYGENGTISIFHKSFADWLMADDSSNLVVVNKSNGHRCIAEYMFDVIESKNNTPTLDEITTLALHVVSSGGMLEAQLTKLKAMGIDTIRDANTGQTVLHTLAEKEGNGLILDTLIQMFRSPDLPDNNGFTPTFIASYAGNIENLKVFIKNGIKLDYHVPTVFLIDEEDTDPIVRIGRAIIRRPMSVSILLAAVIRGHLEAVKLLVESGASVTQTNSVGLTPLHVAAESGHLEILNLLLKHGAKPDNLALHHSAAKNRKQIVRVLLKRGVKDVCLPCKSGNIWDISRNATIYEHHVILCETALHAAVSKRHFEIVELLLSSDKTSLECLHFSGKTPLMAAVENNDTEMVALLLNYGANVETQCPESQTTLSKQLKELSCKLPSRSPLKEHVRYSLHCGKDNCFCNDRALHLSGRYGFWEVAKLLIDANADIMAKNCENLSAVDKAAINDNENFVTNVNHSMFMSAKSHLTVPSIPISYVSAGCYEMLLLHYRHNFAKLVDGEKYALMIAAASWSPYLKDGRIDMNKLVISRNILKTTNLTELLKHESKRRLDVLKLITESLKDVPGLLNARDSETGEILLHVAAKAGFADAVEYLIDQGSDWRVKGKQGRTPLELALEATPKKPVRFEMFYNNFKNLKISGTCTTTTYDETAAYLIYLEKSSLNRCDLESVIILNKILDNQMPLSLYILLRNGVDVNCYIVGTYRPLLKHLLMSMLNGPQETFGKQVGQILNQFNISMTVECEISLYESELHFMSYSSAGIPFLQSNDNHSNVLQRFVSSKKTSVHVLDTCYDSQGFLALHRAAEGGNVDAVEFFISSGTNLFKRTESGLTALDISIFSLEKEVSLAILIHEVVDNIISNTRKHYEQRTSPSKTGARIFKRLLLVSCRANRSKCLSWCSVGSSRLSPLHFAASRGMGMYEFVYKQAKAIMPNFPRNCTNKHGIEPLYLAEIFHPIVLRRGTNEEILPEQLFATNNTPPFFQFPDREAEYHIIYNDCFTTPEVKFTEQEIGDAVSCPGFRDSLLPGRDVLHNRMRQCSEACWIFTSYVYNQSMDDLPFKLGQRLYTDTVTSDEWLSKINLMQTLLYFTERNDLSSDLKNNINIALSCSRECRCTHIMQLLQRVFTARPKLYSKVNPFKAKRMGWKRVSSDCADQDRWPFHFLFKKALKKYKSYSYLKILNSGRDMSNNAYFLKDAVIGDDNN